jgi:catechol 2,3-dioxygenase-like lactoylglutathione lyase family enzyme
VMSRPVDSCGSHPAAKLARDCKNPAAHRNIGAAILKRGIDVTISLVSVSVSDQKAALAFYTQKLGFIKKTDIPMGDVSWLTVVSPESPDGPELVLEPNAGYPAMKKLKEALLEDGIPFTAFEVDDIDAEHGRLRDLGVRFTQTPVESGGVKFAVFDDTCGNLIQIYQHIG